MNYGLPYKGSKNRIAKRLVEALPAAPVLYDVFCGGCAITHAAFTVTRKMDTKKSSICHEKIWRPICQLGT